MAEGGQGSGCPVCKEMANRQYHCEFIFIEEDLTRVPDDGSKKNKKCIRDKNADKFLQYINAFLNSGGGIICLHVNNLHKLGMFEQSVNQRMAELLPDDRPFHEAFERNTKGNNHVIFRVVPGEGHLSTFSFNTKIPFDFRVVNPTHGQMRHLMKTCRRGEGIGDPVQCQTLILTFSKDGTVEVVEEKKPGEATEKSDFQESRSIQAKSVPWIRTSFRDALRDFFQKDNATYLPKYISAFTKLPTGGSIFLGIKEDKIEVPKWTRVEEGEKNELLTLHKENFDLWKDRNDKYFVADSSPVEKEAQESGLFKCEGIKINEEERNHLPDDIRQLIKEHTFWHPDNQQPDRHQVDVVFHVTDSEQELFVVEIKVRRYHGMVFLGKEGPVAYAFPNMQAQWHRQLTNEEWFKIMSDQ